MINRRVFLSAGSASVVIGGAAASQEGGAYGGTDRRQYIINANMVLTPIVGEPLSADDLDLIKSTGLTAFKQSLGGSGMSYEETIAHIEAVDEVFNINPDVFLKVQSFSDLKRAYDTGRIGIIYSFESAKMFQDDLSRIVEFAKRGVRIMQHGYNQTNKLGAGVMSVNEPLGLTERGREAAIIMEQAKVLIDLSHAHEQTAQDILAIATRPLAITHAGCASVYEHPRNKSDPLLRAVAETGGVFGLYEMSYLTADLKQQSLEAFLRHIDHAVNVCGIEHVGIGSDTPFVGFDTSPESLAFWAKITKERQEKGIAAPGEGPPPYVEGLNGPHKMVALGEALQKRGYTAAQVDKILGQNFARLFEAVWT